MVETIHYDLAKKFVLQETLRTVCRKKIVYLSLRHAVSHHTLQDFLSTLDCNIKTYYVQAFYTNLKSFMTQYFIIHQIGKGKTNALHFNPIQLFTLLLL